MTNRKAYPTDLSELEWQIIAPLLPGQKARGRKIVYSRREILNAIIYIVRAGCAWRLLPHDFPPYRIVFHYYRSWQKDCTWTAINDLLRGQVRQAEGRNLSPSAAIIDSQSVRTTEQAGPRGFNGHKLIKGRKRHILVDTLGLLLVVVVHTAEIADSVGARSVLEKARWRFSTLQHIWADGGYVGSLLEWAKNRLQLVVEIVKRSDGGRGFKVLARRWVVERTLAWISRNRRLSKDYESLPESSEALVQIAMIRLMLVRLAKHRRREQRKKELALARKGYALVA